MASIVRQLSSSGNDEPFPHPTPIEELGSTDIEKKNFLRLKSFIIRRRTRRSSSIGNQNSSPTNGDGSRRWSPYASSNSSTGSIVSIAQAQGQNVIDATARLVGGRRRHASDSRTPTPSAAIPKQKPVPSPVDSPVPSPVDLPVTPPATGTPDLFSNNPPGPRAQILLYHERQPRYGFTNFSNYAVQYEKKLYPTSEHLYQSLQFTHYPSLSEHIRTCSPEPGIAFSEAQRFQAEVRKDWSSYKFKAMELAIFLKFSQYKNLREELLSTGDAELIENSEKDSFWGCGPDGKGKNELGKALERLRDTLRK